MTTAPQAPDALTRPSGSCLLCRPPLGTRSWRRAYSGHLTCESCEDKLGQRLGEIANRYEKLNPRPGSVGDLGGRGAPGFGSRSPASEHVIVMMDARSSTVAKVWVGADGRIHQESERAPLSIYTALLGEVYDIAERREMALPDPLIRVRHLTEWLERHVIWLTAQDSVVEFAGILKQLTKQLRPVTGDRPKRPFGFCPNTLNVDTEHTRTCGGPLFPPLVTSSIIRCQACGREWDRVKDEWAQLGKLLKNAA